MSRRFSELSEEVQNRQRMRKWIINQIENTERAHDDIRKDFLKKWPQHGAYFDAVVHEIVD